LASEKTKQILIVPLDWGLGHTSRCIPIILYLQGLGHHVVVAGNNWQQDFIKKSCPGVETIDLEGYEVSYSRKGTGFMFSMFRQMPKLLAAVRKEHDWLIEQSAKMQFDGIISDNRYGLFHKKIPSVIMTHQLAVRTGMGKVANDMLRRLHNKFLQRFTKCWVVDVKEKECLGGKLSHPKVLPDNATYIGLLSQLEVKPSTEGEHLLVLLSGPEPQRSILSEILWKHLVGYKGKVVFVEGSNNATQRNLIPSHVSYYRQITKTELQPLLENANMVICRSGYSTLMDLMALGKKAIVIPTPGQTEQVYLGRYLHEQGVFYSTPQKNFKLQRSLDAAKEFPFKQLSLQRSFDQYKAAVDSWLRSL
jgi:uncharacterized protein (TIGR00661 family)